MQRILNSMLLGDHVVLMGAASKGIIQRGYQHNATVYKTPYAKNPFDSVTDDELKEYKRTVEKKRAGDCKWHQMMTTSKLELTNVFILVTDTDYSESEAFSSLQISGQAKSPPSRSEGMVMRIETTRAPAPSQAEIVMSDGEFNALTLVQAFLQFWNNTKEKTFPLIGFQCDLESLSKELLELSCLTWFLYFCLFLPCFDGFVQLWWQVVEAHLCPSNRIFPQISF